MIKIRSKELRRLQGERPEYYNRVLYADDGLHDIKVRAHIFRDAHFPAALNFVLDEWEYTSFMEMNGIYFGKDDDGVEYAFTFLPSDFMTVISDNYNELNTARMETREKASSAYQAEFKKELDEWQAAYDSIKNKPAIYWEKRSK